MAKAGGPEFYCGKAPGHTKRGAEPKSSQLPPPQRTQAAQDIKHVVMVIRHGDRTSWGWYHDPAAPLGTLSCYPGDTNAWNNSCAYEQESPTRSMRAPSASAPWLSRRVYRHNIQAGQCLQGMLTKQGLDQQRANGARVYADFVKGNIARVLPAHWESAPDAFYIRSTDIERTFMSAESLFAGIYENVTAPSSTDDVPVITIESREIQMDTMFPNPSICPQQAVLQTQGTQSAPFQSFVSTIATPVLSRLNAMFNTNLTLDVFEELLDCTRSLMCNSKSLPSTLTRSLMLEMAAVQAWAYNYLMTYPDTTQGGRVQIGMFMGELLDHIGNAPSSLKFSLFSGHDTTLLPMLLALNQTDVIWPAYADHIKFEIEKDSNNAVTFVNVKYNDELLSLPACGNTGRCSWTQFEGFMTNLIPSTQDCVQ